MIISNNQSSLRNITVTRANLFNFQYSDYSLRIEFIFIAIIHTPQCTAQMMNSHTVVNKCISESNPRSRTFICFDLLRCSLYVPYISSWKAALEILWSINSTSTDRFYSQINPIWLGLSDQIWYHWNAFTFFQSAYTQTTWCLTVCSSSDWDWFVLCSSKGWTLFLEN